MKITLEERKVLKLCGKEVVYKDSLPSKDEMKELSMSEETYFRIIKTLLTKGLICEDKINKKVSIYVLTEEGKKQED